MFTPKLVLVAKPDEEPVFGREAKWTYFLALGLVGMRFVSTSWATI